MRERRIYQPGSYQTGDLVLLSPEASHHLATVLRATNGQILSLFSGTNYEFQAEIREISKKQIRVKILSSSYISRESPCQIHLVQGISKGDKMDFVIQKAVELGVVSIQPIITERSVVKLDAIRAEKKRQTWEAIAVAAAEQSGRNYIPSIYPLITLQDYLAKPQSGLSLVLNPHQGKSWRDFNFTEKNLNLIIGPEGGFSLREIELLTSADCHSLTLGPRILRTETATLVGLSILQAIHGDL